MKKCPPFNVEQARQEAVEDQQRIHKDEHLDIEAENIKRRIEQFIKRAEKDWLLKWERDQLHRGEMLYHNILIELSEDDAELLEDYIQNIKDEAHSIGYEAGFASGGNYVS